MKAWNPAIPIPETGNQKLMRKKVFESTFERSATGLTKNGIAKNAT